MQKRYLINDITKQQFETEKSFAVVHDMTKRGKSEKEIADALGTTTTKVRLQKTMIKDGHRAVEVEIAKDLRDQGYSLNEIAKQMGYKNDSSVRSLLNAESESRMKQAQKTADFLRKQVDEKGMIDIGAGVERELGISREKLNQAVMMLEMEGYKQFGGGVSQVNNPGKQTNLKVLATPDKEWKDMYDYKNVHSLIKPLLRPTIPDISRESLKYLLFPSLKLMKTARSTKLFSCNPSL